MFLKRLFNLLWWSLVVVVVGLAVMLSTVRLLLPGMSAYRVQIESAVAQAIGHRVEIGSLDAAWQKLSPVLKLEQVTVYGSEFPGGALSVREVHVGLDVIRSLTQRQWLTSQVKVIGTQISLDTAATKAAGQRAGGGPLGWLLQQRSISLDDVSLDWHDERWFADTLRLRDASLRLVNDAGRHNLSLDTRLAGDPGDRLTVMADLEGAGHDPLAWRGQLYVNTGELQLGIAEPLFDRLGLSVAGRAALELWAGIDGGQLGWGSGSLTVADGALQASHAPTVDFAVDRLAGSFRWQARAGGWQVELREFGYQRGGSAVWPDSTLNIAVKRDAALRLRGSASVIVIDELRALLRLLPWIDADALSMVDHLQPAGQLREAEFAMEFTEGAAPRFSGRARFDELAVAASGGLPGVTGMSGHIEGNLQAGAVHLDSGNSSLSMPHLFSEELALSQLAGTVRWQRYDDFFRIESEAVDVVSGPLAATARLQLDWPYRAASPWIDLQVASASLPLDQVRHYLPDRVMSPKAVAWLQEAFDAGSAHGLQFLLQGRVDQIPFDAHQGRLEARFDFEDLLLDYHPQWGQLHDARGSALFEGRSMRITANRGRIRTSPLQHVVARIDDLTQPVLGIEGTVEGALSGMLDYVAATPLGDRFGTPIQQFDAGGDVRLQLDLRIPLKRELGTTSVKGDVELKGNRLTQRKGLIVFTDVNGRLRFTHAGISAKKLSGRLFGSSVVGSIYREGAEGAGDTLVDVQGWPDLVAVLVAEQPALAAYVDGEASWRALLRIPEQQTAAERTVELQLQSDLVGIAIDLPEPFYKPATEARTLRINWVPDRSSNRPVLVSYGQLIDARILPTTDRAGIHKADVRFGSATAELPEQREIRLAGQLEHLDVDGWLEVLRSLSAEQGGTTSSDVAPPLTAHLALMNLSLFGHQVKDLRVDSQSADAWQFTLQGDGAAGTLHWLPPAGDEPPHLQLSLDHLRLKPLDSHAQPATPHSLAQPATWPALDIAIAKLERAGRQLGSVAVKGRPVAEGFEFTSLGLRSEAIELQGSGSWLQQPDRESTRFEADITDGRLEELSLLFAKNSAVQGGSLTGRVDLNWRGSPAAFNLANVEGELHLKARDGRLVHVDEGAGKLLNLISLNSLQRRLSLDFSDIVSEGFSFDTLEGRFVLADGDAFTNDFRIVGSSAMINVAGRTGLVAKDYDQLVTVTPQVSSSLPIAGAIAGGPAVGAAVFLAEKLVGKEFNRMTALQYQVTGTWDKPVYERLQKAR